MKLNTRALVTGILTASGLFLAAGPAANTASAQATVSDPVVVKSPKVSTKPLKFVGLVISANSVSMTARSEDNPVQVQSFSYAPAIRNQMIKIVEKGGYQYGDKVRVEYAPGTTVALSIKGKASKPKTFGSTATK
jgi:hypothetical protein